MNDERELEKSILAVWHDDTHTHTHIYIYIYIYIKMNRSTIWYLGFYYLILFCILGQCVSDIQIVGCVLNFFIVKIVLIGCSDSVRLQV